MTTSPSVGHVTSRYGPRTPPRKPDGTYGTAFHAGVDIGGPAGTTIHAPQAGTVTAVASHALRGLYVIVDHGRYRTLHQHLASVSVARGQAVTEGQRIGVMGTTGGVARHLHTEVHDGTTPIDPEPWYAARGVTLGVRTQVAGVRVEDDMDAAEVTAAVWGATVGKDENRRPLSVVVQNAERDAAATRTAVAALQARLATLATPTVDVDALAAAIVAKLPPTGLTPAQVTAACKAAINGARITTS